MSKTKDEIEEAESEWADLASSEGYQCKMCGGDIPYDERKLYFRTGRCAACQETNDD
jgi:hypothetical protein